MATIKIKYRPSTVHGREGSVCYQVIHNRQTRLITTSYKLFPTEWDEARSIPMQGSDNAERDCYLSALANRMEEDLRRLDFIVRKLERSGSYTAEQVVSAYLRADNYESSFFAYARKVIRQTQRMGKERMAEIYASALNSFIRFRDESGDIALEHITPSLMMEYKAYLERNGKCPNTLSFYMRNLRAIYNRASEEGLVDNANPFRHIFTGVEKTVKRAVTADVVNKIRNLDLELYPPLEFARDLFILCFYLRGMSFVDLAFLKKDDLQNNVLVYRRHKTKRQLAIKWLKPMQDIVDRYTEPDSPYLLPIIKRAGINERQQYLNASHLMNKRLKEIGKMVGCPVKLTFYVARHGWASIAKGQQVPLPVISESLGHNSEETTRIYLALLDTSVVDNANDQVIMAVL